MEIVKNLKQSELAKNIIFVVLGTCLLTISANIKIPFYPVPMTMQTFVVLLIGATFGYKIGSITILAYILEGLVGLPVFAGTPEKGLGLTYFMGPTMGYLIGFVLAAFISGKFNYDKKITKNFIKLTFSVSFIYIFGLIWLGILIGWDKPIFDLGAKPFLLAELFKITLLTMLIGKIQKYRLN